ncbi:MAG: hypothetical protein Q9169_003332 [Polycauliona sp. 2 TL-2023]
MSYRNTAIPARSANTPQSLSLALPVGRLAERSLAPWRWPFVSIIPHRACLQSEVSPHDGVLLSTPEILNATSRQWPSALEDFR